jgi:single-strand DNA-binding protein
MESGEKKEETEFHRVVAWNKLAELCSQLLAKGRKIYVEGRLRTNQWQGNDGSQRSTTEVVIEDMIILDSKRPDAGEGEHTVSTVAQPRQGTQEEETKRQKDDKTTGGESVVNEDINPDDIPF